VRPVIPDKATCILIHCNNNFENEPVNVHTCGHPNVHELGHHPAVRRRIVDVRE
jgi:hypothetical protein